MKSPTCRRGKAGSVPSTPSAGSLTSPAWSVNAAAEAARLAGWDKRRVTSFILGHGDGDSGQATTDDRLMFVPLPSITPLKVESIRRVLVVGPPGSDIARIRQFLSGAELMEEGRPDPVAMLSFIPQSDRNVSHYYTPRRASGPR